jgi:hypothetical protein
VVESEGRCITGPSAINSNDRVVVGAVDNSNSVSNGVDVMNIDQELPYFNNRVENISYASKVMVQQTHTRNRVGIKDSLGRRRKIMEPEDLRGVSKECPHCLSHDNKFQYFNNNKETQPRYKCGNCGTKFTYKGRVNKILPRGPWEVKGPVSKISSTTPAEANRAEQSLSNDVAKIEDKFSNISPAVDCNKSPHDSSMIIKFLHPGGRNPR